MPKMSQLFALFVLAIQLKTPTSPGSWSTNSDPKTLHNLKQLKKKKKESMLKKLLRECIHSPPSPTKAALGQLVEVCEMAMDSGVFLAKENQDLRVAHEKQAQKKKSSNRQITIQEGIFIEEGQSLLQSRNQVEGAISTISAESAPEAEQRLVRAPPRCSDCHIIGHRSN